MQTKMLIEELTPSETNIMHEGDTASKDLHLHGIFMQSSIKNNNNRTYPLQLMETVVKEAMIKIEECGGIFGELDHPQTLLISSDRISHLITSLKMEGNDVIGKAKMLETPMGKIGRILVESGGRIGISSRGAGSHDGDGVIKVFNFVTADLVVTPSAPSALPTAVYESIEELRVDGKVVTLAEEIRESAKCQDTLRNTLLSEIARLIINVKK